MSFTLNPRLGADSELICDLPLSQARLMLNAAFPWVVLVPRREGAVELVDLSLDDQAQLTREIRQVSLALRELCAPTKLNVANLGNIVAQLHVHIIARYAADKAWPGPVWNSGVKEDYAPERKRELIAKLAAALLPTAAPTWLFVDFDNTLMGTEQFSLPPLIERFNKLYGDQIDHPLTLAEFKEHFHGQAREVLAANLSRHFGIPVDNAALQDDREWRMMRHLHSIPGGVPMAPGLLEALAKLEARGVRFAFVSNNSVQRGMTAMRYAGNGRGAELARFFGCNFFEAGDTQKPRPDVYLRAMAQVGAEATRSFAVEDSVTGVAAAVAAKLQTFGFTGFADDPKALAQKLLAKGCVACFEHWDEFAEVFEATLNAQGSKPPSIKR